MPVLVLNSLTPNQWTVKVQDSLDTIHHFTTHAARRKFLGTFVGISCEELAKNKLLLHLKSSPASKKWVRVTSLRITSEIVFCSSFLSAFRQFNHSVRNMFWLFYCMLFDSHEILLKKKCSREFTLYIHRSRVSSVLVCSSLTKISKPLTEIVFILQKSSQVGHTLVHHSSL